MRRKPATREQTIRGYLTLAYLAAVAGGFVVFGWAGLFVLAVASLVMAAVVWFLGEDEPEHQAAETAVWEQQKRGA